MLRQGHSPALPRITRLVFFERLLLETSLLVHYVLALQLCEGRPIVSVLYLLVAGQVELLEHAIHRVDEVGVIVSYSLLLDHFNELA